MEELPIKVQFIIPGRASFASRTVVGAAIGGAMDFAETKAVGQRAYKAFVENDFMYGEKRKDDDVIDVEFEDEN